MTCLVIFIFSKILFVKSRFDSKDIVRTVFRWIFQDLGEISFIQGDGRSRIYKIAKQLQENKLLDHLTIQEDLHIVLYWFSIFNSNRWNSTLGVGFSTPKQQRVTDCLLNYGWWTCLMNSQNHFSFELPKDDVYFTLIFRVISNKMTFWYCLENWNTASIPFCPCKVYFNCRQSEIGQSYSNRHKQVCRLWSWKWGKQKSIITPTLRFNLRHQYLEFPISFTFGIV